ncbi:DNA polymerase III, subunits gamma and tau [Ancylobacter novellus DSM 506]|uniref:DNA polymerase III subunit gamma/tau n=1 Tax=Ancylobacter novellus (strain ATCC 8093 / DSM 506 / JCM 20403 / CCM 1077 / IAM 12100 / NBRC 12443 / NCIMB 10456) TaxID=639283 RepID=D7A3V6_ANCN5|nr:DNA polymerase III subunit gamma/tau [Ancylobacter novellus]ADH91733.1 DNA polymerase III, subunits gamma and tau [Ancylobacter novellus DSM 506]
MSADRPDTPDLTHAPDEGAGFGFDLGLAPAPASGAAAAPYRVLARKYRPQTFADLIGQEAMVRTLSNAFTSGRIAQAYILTGVRGVGKTTTARILARALNYEPADGPAGANTVPSAPTLDMPALGRHCRDIIESRHVDVQEMDAASNTGIGDIREIIEAARYKPVLARYKVFIIDEVHMLSTAAFNGLLKTLEEPPEHVKFIFATTEIRKVPVTVLSRTQRFDLRRVEAGTLARHLRAICDAEGVGIDTEALSLVARAAEGSVRDALSLLDQAIAHAGGQSSGNTVHGEQVRALLGLADRGRVIDLFEALMKGDVAQALTELREQYDSGADPAVVIADLAEFTHLVTKLKIIPETADDPALVEAERVRGRDFAKALSMRVLARAWQMLTKGLSEVQQAAKPMQAAEMVLVRLAYASDLPTPDEALRRLREGASEPAGRPVGNSGGGGGGGGAAPSGGGSAMLATAPRAFSPAPAPSQAPSAASHLSVAARGTPSAAPSPAAAPQPAPGIAIATFEELVALASQKRDLRMKFALENNVRLVAFEDGKLELALAAGGSPNLVQELQGKLSEWTGKRWLVALSREEGEPTLAEQAKSARDAMMTGVRADPLVAAALARFPGASIVDVRTQVPDDAPPAPSPDDYEAMAARDEPGPDDEIEF